MMATFATMSPVFLLGTPNSIFIVVLLITQLFMAERWSIIKLDSTNWTTSKFQMQHLLLAKDGTEVLARDANAERQADY